MRLQKYISRCGVTSRRKAEKLITDGRVKVDGDIVTELGTKIDKIKNKVQVDDKYIELEENRVYILLNKPVGYVTTLRDEKDRKIVIDLIDDIDERIYPVGRLDKNTSGLLLLTNDGELTHKLTHPSFEVDKTYLALVEGIPNENKLDSFSKGLEIEDYVTAPAKIKILNKYKSESVLKITIHEGRNRQVRKMCAAIGHPVKELKRISLGELKLGNLKESHWRHLNNKEVDFLKMI